MKKLRIGIQGSAGSTNERACNFFMQKYKWTDAEIQYLISTENVLRALQEGQIDYGTFAWASSRGGLVAETQTAIKKYPYQKIDEASFALDHALLKKGTIDTTKQIHICSHPQALLEHTPFLKATFSNYTPIPEIDTALAAKKLSEDLYPKNTLVIAPIGCAKIYGVEVYQEHLPTNVGYVTTIYLVKKNF